MDNIKEYLRDAVLAAGYLDAVCTAISEPSPPPIPRSQLEGWQKKLTELIAGGDKYLTRLEPWLETVDYETSFTARTCHDWYMRLLDLNNAIEELIGYRDLFVDRPEVAEYWTDDLHGELTRQWERLSEIAQIVWGWCQELKKDEVSAETWAKVERFLQSRPPVTQEDTGASDPDPII